MLLSCGWNAKKVDAGGGVMKVVITLNVIILNKETLPPDADITYESFFDSAIHGTASSGFISIVSLIIERLLFGCQSCG
eukprot:Gb_38995 [translate_table: standard]